MKLKTVRSGGQTGADQTGIECAAELGLKTAGVMPKGFRTDEGSAEAWAKKYGLVEHFDPSYVPRTRQNAKDGDATVWFGKTNSPGYYCTKKAAKDWGKPFHENPTNDEFLAIADLYDDINVAGNRERMNPGVVEQVRSAFDALRVSIRDKWAYGSGPGTLSGDGDI